MTKNNLKSFLILSVAIHIILLSALFIYFVSDNSKPLWSQLGNNAAHKNAQNINVSVLNQSPIKIETKPNAIDKPQKTKKKTIKTTPEVSTKKTEVEAPKTINTHKETENSAKAQTNTVKPKAASPIAKSTGPSSFKHPMTASSEQSTELAHPNYRNNPKPRYPTIARKRGFEGRVLLKVFVLESGRVADVRVLKSSGYQVLDDSASSAIFGWDFYPGKHNGKAVSSWVTVPIVYELNSG